MIGDIFAGIFLGMKDCLVSIIIPTFNTGKYVKEAVDSAVNQTYKNKEIIVVDDGSTDNTREILDFYVRQEKIKYIYQENKGLAGARNTGIKAAKGEFIAFLDSDDIFLPDKIEKQAEFLENHLDCDICYCDIWHFYDDEPNKLMKLDYKYYSGNDVFKNLLKKNFINPLTVVMRRSAVDKYGVFNEIFKRTEDWEYWVRLAWQGVKFCFLPEILAKYRMRKDSLSFNWNSEIQRKELQLKIFTDLNNEMSFGERKRYGIRKIILYHKFKLLYSKLSIFLWPLKKYQIWLQKRRLKFIT